MSDNPLIKIKNLKLRYQNTKILDGVNWDIENSSYNLLIGGNGAGKSTLVKCILGLIDSYTGTIKYKGNKLRQENITQDFGYVPQVSKINKDFPITVQEIIELECKSNQCSIEGIHHLKDIGLAKLYKKKISDLSGGELQKLLIARGLVSHPEVLFLDEPGNNLDKKSREYVFDYLYKLNQENAITIIHITHDPHEVSHPNANTYHLTDKKLYKE